MRGEFVLAGGAVGAAAGAGFHLALVEVLLELGPLCVGGRPVLTGGAQLAPPVEGCLVMAYEVFVEDRLWRSRGSSARRHARAGRRRCGWAARC